MNIDPCMGSGHILVYAFDVLMEIYKECGYGERDAAVEIVKNNIFGLDIDERCSQLAYFAVMMKARSYDRRFLSRKINPHVLSISESNIIGSFIPTKLMTDTEQNKIGEYLVDVFRHAKEIGSLKTVQSKDYEGFLQYLKCFEEKADIDIDFSLWQINVKPLMEQLAEQAKILSKKYAVVCTNPPYMNKIESHLKDFVVNEYKPYSADLFSVFIYRNFDFCITGGYSAFMTPYVWMSIKSYKNLREYVVENKSIITLIQMEYSAFEEATVPICSFVLQNSKQDACGLYFDLTDFVGGMEVQRVKALDAISNPDCGYLYETNQSTFANIPSVPITAFWVSENLTGLYTYPLIGSKFTAKEGVGTRNDDVFLKLHWEVRSQNIGRDKRWILTDKAGGYRKWYLGSSYVMDWEDNGYRIKNYRNEDGTLRSRPQNTQFLFRDGISWGKIGSGASSFRYREEGYGFNDAAPTLFGEDPFPLLSALNTNIYRLLLRIRGGTLNMTCGVIEELPMLGYVGGDTQVRITELSKNNYSISRIDWDSFETSWDFKRHPLICGEQTIETAFAKWKREAAERFDTLKANEEELNRIFIDTYGLMDELTPGVEDKEVTVRRASLQRDIKSLISYAVGCMFGRYSLDTEGLAYAGGTWDTGKYKTFSADKDNILPICDDEYFDDDITGRFIDFVKTVYGADTLEENLKFIADALGGKGTPREVIRSYFLNDFYKDHVKIYQKRPIYWLFDSGKKNGFKALIYMHRYSRDLLAKIRTDYVHEQQERYRTQLSHIASALNTASGTDRAKLLKQQDKLTEQLREITDFEEKVHHLADQNIIIDLDNGVKKNYEIFADVLAKI